jgi:hypothetical protein
VVVAPPLLALALLLVDRLARLRGFAGAGMSRSSRALACIAGALIAALALFETFLTNFLPGGRP